MRKAEAYYSLRIIAVILQVFMRSLGLPRHLQSNTTTCILEYTGGLVVGGIQKFDKVYMAIQYSIVVYSSIIEKEMDSSYFHKFLKLNAEPAINAALLPYEYLFILMDTQLGCSLT